MLVVAYSQVAAAEVARSARRAATFGWRRFSLAGVAGAIGSRVLAARGLVAVGELAIEALCTRVLHICAGTGELGKLAPLVGRPGLARALARTLQEVRLAGIESRALESVRPELSRLLRVYETELARARLADRAMVLRLATERIRDGIEHPVVGHPTLLVDLVVKSGVEQDLVTALATRSAQVLAVAPGADQFSIRHLAEALGVTPDEIQKSDSGGSPRAAPAPSLCRGTARGRPGRR